MQGPLPDSVLLDTFNQVPGMGRAVPAAAAAAEPEAPGGPLYIRRRRTRYTRNQNTQHPWEVAAVELERWIAEMPEQIAGALMPLERAPFAADAPKAEQIDFWLTRFRLPDGTLNQPAIDEFLATSDPDAVRGLAKAIREQLGETP